MLAGSYNYRQLNNRHFPITLVETQYFPSVSFFAFVLQSESIRIEQHENYQKRGLRNKCHITGSHGVETLSIPLQKGKNQQQPIKEVKIANDQAWVRHHWNSLQIAYGKSGFFIHYADKIKSVLDKQHKFLFDLNNDLLISLFKLLHIDFNVDFTSEYLKVYDYPVVDIRNQTDLINTNSHPFIKIESQKYPQIFSDRLGFIDHLSILDLLFCLGPDSKRILKQYKITTKN